MVRFAFLLSLVSLTVAFRPAFFSHPNFGPTSSSLCSATSSPEIVKVPLSDGRDYPIMIGADLLSTHASSLTEHVHGKNVLVISNEKIAPLYMDRVTKIFESAGKMVDTVVLPDGEQYKDLPTLNMIFDKALEKVRMGMGVSVGGRGRRLSEKLFTASYVLLTFSLFPRFPTPSLSLSGLGSQVYLCRTRWGGYR